MKRFLLLGLLSLALGCTPSQAHSEDDANGQILKRDFKRMMELFPGRYDNQEQVYFNDNLDVPEDERHGRIHHIFTPVELENFPGTTFYIEQYQNNDPADVYRQRIYSFEPDYIENAIRLTIYIPKDPESLLNAHTDLSKLDGIEPSQFTTYEGCDVFWKAQLEHFHGYMKKGACRVESKRSGKTLIIEDDLQLSKSAIWIRDVGWDEDGNMVYGNKAGVHHKNNRARNFNCWVSPRKDNGEYAFYNDIPIHDQGGRAWVEANGEHPRVGLKIRKVIWPMGNNRPSVVLYAYKGDDEEKAVSYAWTSPDEPRIGINLRWIQASCTAGSSTITPGINLKTGSGN